MRKNLFGNNFIVLILIAATGLLAYSNTFAVPFQFDDDGYVVNNPVIRSFHYFLAPWDIATLTQQTPAAFPISLRYAFMTRILGHFSLAVNYHLHGLDVTGYHVVNLLLHIINGFLVYMILRSTFNTDLFSRPSAHPVGPHSREVIAFLSAMLFVCHPIQTQAVTYITSRFVLLATFFFLLALYLYLSSRITSSRSARPVLYVAALISASAAMVTKEFTFTLPMVIMLYDLIFFSRSARERNKILAPFFLTLLIIPALIFVQQGALHSLDSTMRTITAADVSKISRSDYLLTQFRVVLTYIRLLFFPLHQNIDHDMPVYHSLFQLPVFASFTVLLALISSAMYLCFASDKARNYPVLKVLSFGMLWFFITLSVESSIIPLGELIAEYRVYLPSVGMITAFVSVAVFAVERYSEFTRQNRVVVASCCVAAFIVLSGATYLRNTVWRDQITLWEDAARHSPALVRPHQNLGTYYSMRGRLEEARRELVTALKLDPRNFELHNNLGIVYKKLKDYDHAIEEFQTVQALMPSDGMVHYNLGNVYLEQGLLPEAIREYEACLKVVPDYDEAYNNLGIAYERSGRLSEAVKEFTEAVSLNPGNVNAKNNLIHCAVKRGTPEHHG